MAYINDPEPNLKSWIIHEFPVHKLPKMVIESLCKSEAYLEIYQA